MNTNHGLIRPKRTGWRLVARVGMVLALLLGGGLWSATAAQANHPEVIAEVDCTGTVTFTAVAFTPGDRNPARRTNPRVDVFYSTDGGKTEVVLPWDESWQYNPASDFKFTDTFQLPQPLPKNVVVGVKKSRWANGSPPGPDFKTRPIALPKCVGGNDAAPADQGGAGTGAGATDQGNSTPAVPVIPAAQAAPAPAAEGGNNAVIIVAALIGVALVIDAVGITLFLRRRRAGAAAATPVAT